MTRYALYLAPPPGSPLPRRAAAWFGHEAVPGPPPDRRRAITASPRRYGFHATLKAPFRLKGGTSAHGLHAAVDAFAKGRTAFPLRLEVAMLKGFVACRLAAPSPPLQALADEVVRAFDPFRAPPDGAELARRRRSPLTPAQDANLEAWGYPYVFDDFTFHMTLSERLAGEEAERVLAAARDWFGEVLVEPFVVDAIGIFEEKAPGAEFQMTGRYVFEA